MPVPNDTLRELLADTLASATLRIALISDATAYTFDPDNHLYVSDVLDGGTTAQEFAGTSGYTGPTDRQTLQNVSVTTDNTDDEGVFDADDVTWQDVDGSNQIQGYLVYIQVGGDDSTPGDDRLVQVVDDANNPSLPISVNGANIVIGFDGEGILNVTN